MKNYSICFFVLLVFLSMSCSLNPKLIHDAEIGKTEDYILQKWGSPTNVSFFNANEGPINDSDSFENSISALLGKKNVLVKTIYYRNRKGSQYFFLTDSGELGWKVISDIYIPNEVKI